jgi:hypothetical protein
MKYLIAWSVFACLIYGGVSAATAWRNPWEARSQVMDMLPPASAGCGVNCQ